MQICDTCGTRFDPERYQLIANGRAYHSVDCALTALAEGRSEEAGEPPGRIYSAAGMRRRGTDWIRRGTTDRRFGEPPEPSPDAGYEPRTSANDA